jgi:hypothetical protein
MLGLAAMAALATMALVGATTASADSGCLVKGHHESECPAASVYNGSLVGLTEVGNPAVLLGPELKVEEKCHGKTLANFVKSEGAHVGALYLVEPLEFSGCEGLCKEVVGENPSLLLVEALKLDAWVTKDPEHEPASAKFQSCPFGATCLYKLLAEPQLLRVEEDFLVADHVKLNRSQGLFCPAEGFWDAKYLVTEDKVNGNPVYAAALP